MLTPQVSDCAETLVKVIKKLFTQFPKSTSPTGFNLQLRIFLAYRMRTTEHLPSGWPFESSHYKSTFRTPQLAYCRHNVQPSSVHRKNNPHAALTDPYQYPDKVTGSWGKGLFEWRTPTGSWHLRSEFCFFFYFKSTQQKIRHFRLLSLQNKEVQESFAKNGLF